MKFIRQLKKTVMHKTTFAFFDRNAVMGSGVWEGAVTKWTSHPLYWCILCLGLALLHIHVFPFPLALLLFLILSDCFVPQFPSQNPLEHARLRSLLQRTYPHPSTLYSLFLLHFFILYFPCLSRTSLPKIRLSMPARGSSSAVLPCSVVFNFFSLLCL